MQKKIVFSTEKNLFKKNSFFSRKKIDFVIFTEKYVYFLLRKFSFNEKLQLFSVNEMVSYFFHKVTFSFVNLRYFFNRVTNHVFSYFFDFFPFENTFILKGEEKSATKTRSEIYYFCIGGSLWEEKLSIKMQKINLKRALSLAV